MNMFRLYMLVLFCVIVSDISTADAGFPLTDKTLVVWASSATLDQEGGSALTINDTTKDLFDGIIFGELEPKVWMPGSNGFSRTNKDQDEWPKETVGPDAFVQIAIVYNGKHISLYRNGEPYASYDMIGEPAVFDINTAILFGQRHLNPGVDCFYGRVRDARVYTVSLEQSVIAGMKPGQPVEGVEPWAWWDFAVSGTYEKMGRFNQVRLTGGARVEDGALVLDGEQPLMLATMHPEASGSAVEVPTVWSKDGAVPPAAVQSARLLREKFMEDPYRPGYHFCVPEDNGMPGDPNGCFFANGRYHLMYLYNRTGSGFSWGHVSSNDLVHWRHHEDAIGPGDGDEGCFSGGGFVDDDGTAYLTYWMLWGDKGIGIAESKTPHYEHWKKFKTNPVIKSTDWGVTEKLDEKGNNLIYGSADPSNIWKKDGKYYVLTGNLLVLNKYGRKEDSPEAMRGDRLYLFESTDLKDWQYNGVFYERRPEWTDDSEDNMCPSFLPLPKSPEGGTPSDKHLLLFISHNKGCQYYVGDYDKERDRFTPETHGRMTWMDNTYFAPEVLIDGKGRQIMWAWLTDNPAGEESKGWSGVYGLPRTLWLGEDGALQMAPVEELKMLRCSALQWNGIVLDDGETQRLDGVVGDSCELEITVAPESSAAQVGVKVRVSPDMKEETVLYYDASKQELCFDSHHSGIDGRRGLERAPFALKQGEPLTLRVFVDKSVIEVYANNRQAICRRVYPGQDESLGIVLFAKEGKAIFSSVKAWEMMPSNPY